MKVNKLKEAEEKVSNLLDSLKATESLLSKCKPADPNRPKLIQAKNDILVDYKAAKKALKELRRQANREGLSPAAEVQEGKGEKPMVDKDLIQRLYTAVANIRDRDQDSNFLFTDERTVVDEFLDAMDMEDEG